MIVLDIIWILVGLCDLAMFLAAVTKHWRISISLFAGITVVVILCAITGSSAFRWIIGFHALLALITAGIIWDQKKGALLSFA